MAKPNVRKVVCGSCAWDGPEPIMIPLEQCRHLNDRLTPGDEVPAGECPECFAFCYLVKPAYVGGV